MWGVRQEHRLPSKVIAPTRQPPPARDAAAIDDAGAEHLEESMTPDERARETVEQVAVRACRRAAEVGGDDEHHVVRQEISGGDVPFELLTEGCPHRALGAEEVGGLEMAEAEAGALRALPGTLPAQDK